VAEARGLDPRVDGLLDQKAGQAARAHPAGILNYTYKRGGIYPTGIIQYGLLDQKAGQATRAHPAGMNTATIRVFTLPLKRFLDRVFLAAFSLRQLIFY